ncbi:hypothetical protein ACVW00_001640 [Marmoricola sp. URHA0025 HA25]
MSRELRDLLRGIVEKQDLIQGWAVDVGPGGSALRAETRRVFGSRDAALDAARRLLDELVRSSPREVIAAAPTTVVDQERRDGQAWRGVVDLDLAPL